MLISLKVNGATRSVDVEPDTPLLYVLRNDLGLNAAKFGCGLAQCGTCTVLIDDKPVRSCVTRPEFASSFRWKESVAGATPNSSWMTPGVSPRCPATTRARKTSSRIG